LLGTDRQLSDDYLIGFSINRDDRTFEFSNNSSEIESNTLTVSNYHSFRIDNKHYLDIIINYSDIDIDYFRTSSGNKYYGDRKAESIAANIAYSQVFAIQNFSFTPNIQYRHGLTIFEKFNESSGSESLLIGRQHVDLSSMQVSLQVNALENYEILLGNNNKLIVKPYASIDYSENLNRGSLISASYVSNPETVYSIKQTRTFNSSQKVNLGLNISNSKNGTSLIEFNRLSNSEGDWENSFSIQFNINF
jgi:outer membrane autotransporter protein